MATTIIQTAQYLNTAKMFKYDVLINQYMNEFEKYVYGVLRNNKNVIYVYRFKDRTSGVRGYAPADFLVITKSCTVFLEVKSRRGRLPCSDFRKSQITTARKLDKSHVHYYFVVLDSITGIAYVFTYNNVINLINEVTAKDLSTVPWDIMKKYAKLHALKRYAVRYVAACANNDEGDIA